jgi:hypothetical protein
MRRCSFVPATGNGEKPMIVNSLLALAIALFAAALARAVGAALARATREPVN